MPTKTTGLFGEIEYGFETDSSDYDVDSDDSEDVRTDGAMRPRTHDYEMFLFGFFYFFLL